MQRFQILAMVTSSVILLSVTIAKMVSSEIEAILFAHFQDKRESKREQSDAGGGDQLIE